MHISYDFFQDHTSQVSINFNDEDDECEIVDINLFENIKKEIFSNVNGYPITKLIIERVSIHTLIQILKYLDNKLESIQYAEFKQIYSFGSQYIDTSFGVDNLQIIQRIFSKMVKLQQILFEICNSSFYSYVHGLIFNAINFPRIGGKKFNDDIFFQGIWPNLTDIQVDGDGQNIGYESDNYEIYEMYSANVIYPWEIIDFNTIPSFEINTYKNLQDTSILKKYTYDIVNEHQTKYQGYIMEHFAVFSLNYPNVNIHCPTKLFTTLKKISIPILKESIPDIIKKELTFIQLSKWEEFLKDNKDFEIQHFWSNAIDILRNKYIMEQKEKQRNKEFNESLKASLREAKQREIMQAKQKEEHLQMIKRIEKLIEVIDGYIKEIKEHDKKDTKAIQKEFRGKNLPDIIVTLKNAFSRELFELQNYSKQAKYHLGIARTTPLTVQKAFEFIDRIQYFSSCKNTECKKLSEDIQIKISFFTKNASVQEEEAKRREEEEQQRREEEEEQRKQEYQFRQRQEEQQRRQQQEREQQSLQRNEESKQTSTKNFDFRVFDIFKNEISKKAMILFEYERLKKPGNELELVKRLFQMKAEISNKEAFYKEFSKIFRAYQMVLHPDKLSPLLSSIVKKDPKKFKQEYQIDLEVFKGRYTNELKDVETKEKRDIISIPSIILNSINQHLQEELDLQTLLKVHPNLCPTCNGVQFSEE